MADTSNRHPIALKRFKYSVAGMDEVVVTRDIPYFASADGPLTMDIYQPPATGQRAALPAVVIAAGYRDIGVPLVLGCHFKEMGLVVSLAQLIAMHGMAAVAYTTSDPAADAGRVVDYLSAHGAARQIDASRIGVWAASGNVPVALALLMDRKDRLRAAMLSTGYTLDLEGTAVADAAQAYRFVNAARGRTLSDLPPDVALFLVRAGREEFAGLNDALDRFAAEAIARNLPLTLVNHSTGPHGFELDDDSPTAAYIVRAMLAFMRFHLEA